MATMNNVRLTGYLVTDPYIESTPEGGYKAIFTIRTVRRATEGYNGRMKEDVLLFYDQNALMPRIKKLHQYDLIDVEGVFDVLGMEKHYPCPNCGSDNVKQGTITFIYPIYLRKINGLREAVEKGELTPDEILKKHFNEVSNKVYLIGTVDTDPEAVSTPKSGKCCRYRLRVERQYLIKTQQTQNIDFPWVYSYGEQAERDMTYLHKDSVVLVRGFIRNRTVQSHMGECQQCGVSYDFPDVATEFVPYSVEYLSNFENDQTLAAKKILENFR